MIVDLLKDFTPITTKRLTLRLLEEEDAEDIFEIRGDADTTSDAGIPCMESMEDAKDYIQRWYEDCVAVVLGNEVIGLIESYTDDNLLYDTTFLGYYMKHRHRNKGYMTEALTALRNKRIEDGFSDTMLWILPGNEASRRVAIRSGWTSLGCCLVDLNGFNIYVEFFR